LGLLASESAIERAASARLLVDMDELARVEWAPLELYASVRGIRSLEAARRNLFRAKTRLGEQGVELAVVEKNGLVSARFGTRAIRELIEADLRAARALVLRLEARRDGHEIESEALDQETEILSPETIALEYRGRTKSFAWIARKHGAGKGRIRKLLVSTGPIRTPEARRRVERRRPKAVVERALEAADRGARLAEVAAILACSKATAASFLRRNGRHVSRVGRPEGA
jgi:hypothetical protein